MPGLEPAGIGADGRGSAKGPAIPGLDPRGMTEPGLEGRGALGEGSIACSPDGRLGEGNAEPEGRLGAACGIGPAYGFEGRGAEGRAGGAA